MYQGTETDRDGQRQLEATPSGQGLVNLPCSDAGPLRATPFHLPLERQELSGHTSVSARRYRMRTSWLSRRDLLDARDALERCARSEAVLERVWQTLEPYTQHAILKL